MLVNISNEQVNDGHEVYIALINNAYDEGLMSRIDSRVKIIELRRKVGSKSPMIIWRLNRMIASINPDVIHLHYATIARWILSKKRRRMSVITLHDLCTEKNSKDLYRGGRVVAISKAVKDDIAQKRNLDSVVIYNGINFKDINQRKRQLSPDEEFKIVQVSRLECNKKGQDLLIEAVSDLIKRGRRNVSLTFLGDGSSRQQLEELVSEHGIDSHVKFLGSKSQEYIFQHLCDYDLFVQPSRFEGFGLTVAEAMAARLPLIVSDGQGPMEIIDNGKYGKYFEIGNVKQLVECIEDVMENYPDDNYLDGALHHVQNTFDVRITASRYVDEYTKVIETR